MKKSTVYNQEKLLIIESDLKLGKILFTMLILILINFDLFPEEMNLIYKILKKIESPI
jgi:hypothetical protein